MDANLMWIVLVLKKTEVIGGEKLKTYRTLCWKMTFLNNQDWCSTHNRTRSCIKTVKQGQSDLMSTSWKSLAKTTVIKDIKEISSTIFLFYRSRYREIQGHLRCLFSEALFSLELWAWGPLKHSSSSSERLAREGEERKRLINVHSWANGWIKVMADYCNLL